MKPVGTKRGNQGGIDVDFLINLINRKMSEDKISQLEAGRRMDLPKETLSGIIRTSRTPDFDNLLKICRWLGITPELVIKDSKTNIQISSEPDAISAIVKLIKKDTKLSDIAKEGLIELMDCAYRRFVQVQ